MNEIDLKWLNRLTILGHVMDLETIAEFVENNKSKTYLEIIAVNYVQGYGVDRPKPLSDIINNTHD